MAWKGMDVSEFQSDIDWNAVKSDGVEFVIIRAGYSTRQDYEFDNHIQGANSVGLHIGLYVYSLAENTDEAISEADFALGLANQCGCVDMPIYIDCEESGLEGCADGCARAFCDHVNQAGYRGGVYASGNWWANYLDMNYWSDKPVWGASYPQGGWSDPNDCPDGNYGIWQCSSSCAIAGVGAIDGDWAYVAEWESQNTPKDTTPPTGDKPFSDRPVCKDKAFGIWIKNVKDDVGIASVKIAIWSVLEGQRPNKLWHDMSKAPNGEENAWAYSIKVNDFGGMIDGNKIITDVYAYDKAGNSKNLGRVETVIDAKIYPQVTHSDGKVTYTAHCQNIGWQNTVSDCEVAGTTGRNLRLEALTVQSNIKGVEIETSAHVSDIGWQKFTSQEYGVGTIGQSKAIEAIKIQLKGDNASKYDIYYRVHVSGIGWMNWAKNGEVAGTTGLKLNVEAIQIMLQGKGLEIPLVEPDNKLNTSTFTIPKISGQYHSQNIGWKDSINEDKDHILTLGTTGQSLKLECFKIKTDDVNIIFDAEPHIENLGWCKKQAGASGVGTTGKNLGLQAIKLRTNCGFLSVWYRCHVSNIGWMGWTRDNEKAGTEGLSLPIECIQICIKGKHESAPGKTDCPFKSKQTNAKDNTVKNNAPNLAQAVQNMINLVNDPAHGYSQTNRWGENGDYDCSSAIITALKQAGFDTGNASYTGNMSDELCARGWERCYDEGYPQVGDICLNDINHVAMCVGDNGLLAQFSISENGGIDGEAGDQTGGESSIMDFYDYPWNCYLRYIG